MRIWRTLVNRGFLKEFELLSKDCGFLLPDISFRPYSYEKGRKMKRVERRGAEPVKGRYI